MVLELATVESDPPQEFSSADLNLELEPHECRFGRWYQGPGMHRFGHRAAFQKIEGAHDRVHRIAAQMIELWRIGRLGQLDELKQKLLANRDLLLSCLESLREYR